MIKKLITMLAMSGLSHGQFKVGGGQSNFEGAERVMQIMANELGESICTTSMGGQNIRQWVSSNTDGDYERGPLYLEHFFAGDGSSLVEKHAIENSLSLSSIDGFFWGQGEAGAEGIRDYEARLSQMIVWFQEDWGIPNDIPIVVMSISALGLTSDYDDVFNEVLVNQQLQLFLKNYGNADIIDTTFYNKGDIVHNNGPNRQRLCRQFWKRMYRLEEKNLILPTNRPALYDHN